VTVTFLNPYRFVSSFDPASLSPVLWLAADGVLYQDSARTTLATSDGDPVGSWSDKSGANAHAAQATSAKRPLYKTNIINGKPVLRPDGVDDAMAAALASAVSSGACTIYLVVSVTATGNGLMSVADVFGGDDYSGSNFAISKTSGTEVKITYNVADRNAVTWAAGTPLIVTALMDGSPNIYKNGTEGTAGAAFAGAAGKDDIALFARMYSSNYQNYGAHDIAEVLIYGAAHDATQRGNVHAYLGAKYGITVV
jgi:hypothetical protein